MNARSGVVSRAVEAPWLRWAGPTRGTARARLRWLTGEPTSGGNPARRVVALFERHPRWTATAAGVGAGVGAAVVAGPVAGAACATYALLAVGAWFGRARSNAANRTRAAAVEALATVVGDLRAGLPIDAAAAAVAGATRRLAAAVQVAERVGAPLADLLERVERDLRAEHRVRQSVQAETAGVRATGYLLAALPAAGIGLGYGMGADPLSMLLHTPPGAACVLSAVALQCAGLVWTSQLCKRAVGADR